MSATDTNEEWRVHEDFPTYEVSNCCRVASWRPERNLAKPPKEKRILKPSTDKDGYKKYILVNKDGIRKDVRRCALVAELWHGPRPNGCVVRHLDGSKDNDTPNNLQWGTPKENAHDMIAHGTKVQGLKVNTAKLTPEIVRLIKSIGKGNSYLAKEYGVTPGAIWHIRAGRTWKSVS